MSFQNLNYQSLNKDCSSISKKSICPATLPPQPNLEKSISQIDVQFESRLCCCISNEMSATNHHSLGCFSCLSKFRKCLSSIAFYLTLLGWTIILVILLLIEVLLNSDILRVVETDGLKTLNTTSTESTNVVSTWLHWSSFIIISFFFVEVLCRLLAWRMEFMRNIIEISDAAVVVCSFTSNLTTYFAARTHSPWTGLSLLIVFRFIRVYSLLKATRREAKKEFLKKMEFLHTNLAKFQMENLQLQKAITDRDFEIKQLLAHLGSGNKALDEELHQVIENSKSYQNKNDFESRLKQAIEISKMEFDNKKGFVNYSFEQSTFNETAVVAEVHHPYDSTYGNAENQPGTSQQFSKLFDKTIEENIEVSASSFNTKSSFFTPVIESSQKTNTLPNKVLPAKKLVKIIPKKLHNSNETAGWVYKNNSGNLSSDDDDEGIESSSPSLQQNVAGPVDVDTNVRLHKASLNNFYSASKDYLSRKKDENNIELYERSFDNSINTETS